MELSNVQELIERSILEKIRLEIVSNGFLPDITTFPETQDGVTWYGEAVNDIIQEKGFIVDIFTGGSNYNKGIKKIPRIVLNPGSFLEGEIGADPFKKVSRDEDGKYIISQTSNIVNYYFEIHLVSCTIQQERILGAILTNALSKRKYVKVYNDPTDSFFVRYLNYYDGDSLDQGIIEKIYSYEVPDCYEGTDNVLSTGVSPISRIDMNINLKNYYEGTIVENLMVYGTLHGIINTGSKVKVS